MFGIAVIHAIRSYEAEPQTLQELHLLNQEPLREAFRFTILNEAVERVYDLPVHGIISLLQLIISVKVLLNLRISLSLLPVVIQEERQAPDIHGMHETHVEDEAYEAAYHIRHD